MLDEVRKEGFSEREEGVQAFWHERHIFKKTVESRKDSPFFTFYDGPPFATGVPHYGHLLAQTIKDVVPRYKAMKGFCVPRRFGWDCHGLPVESLIEQAHELSGAASIEEFGIPKFNEECRNVVLRYTKEWEETVHRMGRWVDFSDTYRTMDLPFMESVWWVFKQIFDKGLVYEGYKVMPFSARLGTPLSNFEATQNYKDVDDPSLTVSLPVLGETDTFFLIWTTTPWTLISNLAVTAGPNIDYVKVKDVHDGNHYILAEARLPVYYKDTGDYHVVETFKGSTLEGKEYEPLFPYFASHRDEGAFRVILGDFVTTEDGTGLVHTAPAFGEDDFYACQKAGITPVCPVDQNGKFTKEVPDYEGQWVKDADKEIAKHLKANGRVIKQTTIRHRYPFCWRTDTPLIYRSMRTWFVGVEKIKEDLVAANQQIHWTPNHIKEGRFGKWLEGARDWAISRNRYWGTPIPIWRSEDGDVEVMGSIAELEELTGEKITDLHRHHIDHLTFEKNGKTYRRIPEVFDCWFESGSMPYAQNHYPFENKELTETGFPADFIAEGLDQTRGWFYTLNVLSVALFNKPAFKNVIVNGIILAEDGNKMSKRLKNYPDVEIVLKKYGADAIRLYMLNSPAVRADDLSFSERGVELVLRQVLIPLWNAYSFFVTYARINGWKGAQLTEKPAAVIDCWMLSRLHKLVRQVEVGMDDFDLNLAVEPFVGFVDQLTNWYIRRCRRRFWSDEPSKDRDEAFATLYTVLLELSKIAAPFIPFISESIYRNLAQEGALESVHLCDYPTYHEALRDESLEEAMAVVQKAVSLGHALRKEHKLKVRQPLPAATVSSPDARVMAFLQEQQHLVADELNVKEIRFATDDSELVRVEVRPNFRALGQKVGKKMPLLQKAIKALPGEAQEALLGGGEWTLDLDGEPLTLTSEDVEVRRHVREGLIAQTDDNLTVALDTAITPDLVTEGLAREVVNKVNTMRRDAGFEVTDRIEMKLGTTEAVKKAFEVHGEYIRGEILATEVAFEPCEGTEWDLNGEAATILLTKVAKA